MPICPTCQNPCEEGMIVCPLDGTRLSADQMIGAVLGDRYRILHPIGAGGMGTVYLCEHVVLGKKIAVKILRPEYSQDEEVVQRFQQEAVAASQIGQENIVDVTDFGRTPGGSLYFVMEALDGESLGTILRREGALSVARALPILSQICRALGAAHARGIVHRDLKPDNVVVMRREDGSDFSKVLDFGISKMAGVKKNGRITRAGMIIGTPEYMAPEQAAAADVDHRADVYAFGVLAYEMVTGVIPFHGSTALGTLMMHKNDQPAPPSQRRPEIPLEVEALILHALEKDPRARQQSMAEMGDELSFALVRYGLPPVYTPTRPAAPAPWLESTPQVNEAVLLESTRAAMLRGGTLTLEPRDTEPQVFAEKVQSRRRWPILLGATAAIVVAGLFGLWRTGLLAATLAEEAAVPLAKKLAAPLAKEEVDPPAEKLVWPLAGEKVASRAEPVAVQPLVVEPATLAASMETEPSPPVAEQNGFVLLKSTPVGAEVFMGKTLLGVTPLEVEVPAKREIEYRFQRSGYSSVARRVRADARVVEVRLARTPSQEPVETRAADEQPPKPPKERTLKPDPF